MSFKQPTNAQINGKYGWHVRSSKKEGKNPMPYEQFKRSYEAQLPTGEKEK